MFDPPTYDVYAVLGVSSTASTEEIRKSFKKLALENHPDKNPNGEVLFKKVSEAYEILSDDVSRRRYDRERNGAYRNPRGSRDSNSTDSSVGSYADAPLRNVNVSDMFNHDMNNYKKKGGIFGDFAKWRAEAEAERAHAMRECERKNLEREREEEAARVREEAMRLKKERDNEAFKKKAWQDEMERWEAERAEARQREKQEEEKRKRDAAEARLKELAKHESTSDDILEQIRRSRQQEKEKASREFIPTEGELEAKTDMELDKLEKLLQSRLEFIKDLKGKRSKCIGCYENPRSSRLYPCGHPSKTCEACAPNLRACTKCHAPLFPSR